MEEEDIGRYFEAALEFIDRAQRCGGAALVHCHEGKSRSVTLVLAYFMHTKARRCHPKKTATQVLACCRGFWVDFRVLAATTPRSCPATRGGAVKLVIGHFMQRKTPRPFLLKHPSCLLWR
jgi:hypothetical protein